MKDIKDILKPTDETNAIPPLNYNGSIFNDEIDKANILNIYFTEQTKLDNDYKATPDVNIDPYRPILSSLYIL